MGSINKIKFTVHPLFIAFGFYYAILGRIFEFVIYTLSSVIHELGHSFSANNFGFKLNKIVLLPFGAIASGNIDGIKPADEIAVALAGPIVNILLATLFIACWWIYPECYAFTDILVWANLTLGIINLIPAYPLDGGRVLNALLKLKLGKDKSKKICRVSGIFFSAVLFTMFIISCTYKANLSVLFFSLFVFFGAIDGQKENAYVKLYSSFKKSRLKYGLPIVRQAVDKDILVKNLVKILNADCINEIEVYDGKNPITLIKQERLEKIIESASLYDTLNNYINT